MLGKIPILTSIFFKFRWFHHQPEKNLPRFSASRCFILAVEECVEGKNLWVENIKNKKNSKHRLQRTDLADVLFCSKEGPISEKWMKNKRLSFFCAGCFALEGGEFATFFKKRVNFQTWKMLPTPIQIMVKLGVPKLSNYGGFNPGLPGSFFVNHL